MPVVKKFKFKFEPLLKLRKMREEQQKILLAEAVANVQQLQQQIEQIDRNSNVQSRSMFNKLAGSVQVEPILQDRQYLNYLHLLRTKHQKQLDKAQQAFDEARLQLAEARKQTEIMAKLKERAWQQYMRQYDRYQQQELDEQANVTAAWRKAAVG